MASCYPLLLMRSRRLNTAAKGLEAGRDFCVGIKWLFEPFCGVEIVAGPQLNAIVILLFTEFGVV